MKNLKKLMAVTLAAAITVTAMVPAFAAAPAVDAKASDAIKESVTKLSALGVVNGKEDGKFHEEANLTRDEFAKMLVGALNLDNAAKAAKGTTKFSDVPSDRWSSGYINVAVSRGIVNGRADGTFGPSDNVTYAEAITMAVRAIGFKDKWLDGSWPSNMINKADEVGLLDDLKSTDGTATRGSAAIIVKNVLDAGQVKQSDYGDDAKYTFDETNTVLKDKLKIDEVEDVDVDKVPKMDEGLKKDEVYITINKKNDSSKSNDNYSVAAGIDPNALLYEKLDKVWINDDDVIVYYELKDNQDIFYGYVTEDGKADDKDINIQKQDGTDDDYEIKGTEFTGMLDNDKKTFKFTDLKKGMYGKFILEDGKIKHADIYEFKGTDDYAALYVSEVKAADKYFKGYNTSGNEQKVDLSDYDGIKVYGDAGKLEDIKADDIVYVAKVKDTGDDYAYLFVRRSVVQGKLERTNSEATELKIEGKTYDSPANYTTYSTDGDKDIKGISKAKDLDDLISVKVVAVLDIKGEVRHVKGAADSKSGVVYGVITKLHTTADGSDAVRVYVPATDTSVSYKYDNGDYPLKEADHLYKPVALTVDANNEVSSLTVINITDGQTSCDAITDVNDDLDTVKAISVTSFDEDYDYMVADDGKKYYVGDDSVMANISGDKNDDPEVVKWADIKDQKITEGNIGAVILAEGTAIKFVAFTRNYDIVSSDYTLAVVTDRFNDKDQKATLDIYDEKDNKTMELNARAEKADEGDIIIYQTSDGKVKSVVRAVYDSIYATQGEMDATGFDVVVGKVTKVDGTVVTFSNLFNTATSTAANSSDSKNDFSIKSETSVKVNSKVEVYVLKLDDPIVKGGKYDTIKKGSIGDISEGDDIRVIYDDEHNAVMVVVVED